MAKTESTAVNDLIKIATTQTPLRQDPSDDLMFTVPAKKDRSTNHHALVPRGTDVPLPRERAPHGTQQNAIAMPVIKVASAPALPTTASVPALAPPMPRGSAPIAQPPELLGDASEPIATRATRPSLPPPTRAPGLPPARTPLPSEYPVVSAVHSQPLAPAPLPTRRDEPVWADDSLDVDVGPFRGDSTAQVVKPRTTLEWMIKLAPLAGAMILLGVVVGGYLVIERQGGRSRSATAAAGSTVEVRVVADEAPIAAASATDTAPQPAVAAAASAAADVTPPTLASPSQSPSSITPPAPTAGALAGRPVLVDVRIDSRPPGATVTLVDRGKQTFLGTTPISTAVDPSRAYDVVFSHPRRPTQTAHLDPKTATRLAVVLGRSATSPTSEAAKAVSAAPIKVTASGLAEPAWDAQIEKAANPAKAEKVAAVTTAGGTGTLMISSKPPCEIHVDGKPTGLMTPQRALSLAVGKHKITLVNPTQKIKKSLAVDITANESTKVIQDLTELMK